MPLIQTTRHDDILQVHLDRPPVNALNPELLGELRDAVAGAPAQGVRGIVISGGPKVFSGGLDVPYMLTLERPALREAWGAFFAAAQAIATSPLPVVAAMAGHSPAGGCVLALCCDYRVMATGPYRIGLNEVEVGLVVPEGIQHLMARVVGHYRAERLVVSGTMLDAAQAHAIGLVDELVDIDHVATRAIAWLRELLAKPSTAMLATRAIARADLVDAMTNPARIALDGFIDGWFAAETQAVLQGLVARLKK